MYIVDKIYSNVELQAEVSEVCGDSVGSFEEIVEKLEQDIEETNE